MVAGPVAHTQHDAAVSAPVQHLNNGHMVNGPGECDRGRSLSPHALPVTVARRYLPSPICWARLRCTPIFLLISP